MVIIIGVVLVVAVILLVIGMSGQPSGQDLVDKRLGKKSKRKKKDEEVERSSVIGAAVDRVVANRGFAQNIATQLSRANLKWTVGEFLVLCALLGLSGALVMLLLNRLLLAPVLFIVGIVGPFIYIAVRRSKRLKDFNDQLSDTLNLMVNSMRAGYSTTQAMEVISKEMPPPMSEEFGRVVLELQLGVTFETTMANLLRRVPSNDLDLVITAMSVQREVGGNLAEVLDSISFTIRERVRIKGEINSLTAQGRITGFVITGIPFVLTFILNLINPEFMSGLFRDPCGWAMLSISFILIVLGFFTINKIVSIEV